MEIWQVVVWRLVRPKTRPLVRPLDVVQDGCYSKATRNPKQNHTELDLWHLVNVEAAAVEAEAGLQN